MERKLFKTSGKNKNILLNEKKRGKFNSFVMKGIFLAKRARQDIQPLIAYLSTRTKAPTSKACEKLTKIMQFWKGTRNGG